MKYLASINIIVQVILILFIAYILLFRLHINYDFILAFMGIWALNIWQVIKYILAPKQTKLLPAYLISIVCYSLIVLAYFVTYNYPNYKLLIGSCQVIAVYTFCMDCYYYFKKIHL